MRNKGFFWTITIALVIATIYQLSFTTAARKVEKRAVTQAQEALDSIQATGQTKFTGIGDTLDLSNPKDVDKIFAYYKDAYISSMNNEEVHFMNYTYKECKEKELNLGLDLRGGMSLTLEISVPELIQNLAGNTQKEEFTSAYNSAMATTNEGDGDFISNFQSAYEKNSPDGKLAKLFHRYNTDEVPSNASNDEVVSFLRNKASSALEGVETIIIKRINQIGINQPTIQKQAGANRIFVELPGATNREYIRKRLQASANLEFFEVYDNVTDGIANTLIDAEGKLSRALYGDILPVEDSLNLDTDTTLLDAVTETVENATDLDLDLAGVDTTATPDLADVAETPTDSLSLDERQKLAPITSLVYLAFQFDEAGTPIGYQEGPVIGQALVKDTGLINSRINHPTFKNEFPADLKFMWGAKEVMNDGQETGVIYLYAIKVPTIGAPVSGEDIERADIGTEFGKVDVRMNMTPSGSQKWEDLTGANVGRSVAITMDDFVYSAPVVQEKMSTGRASISGSFTVAEGKDLAGLLNAGSLPAPAKIVNETSVGPTLGAENIQKGLYSFLFAILIVLIYMVFYYGKAGVIADIAMIFNLFLLLGMLVSFKAILTLPGIAGIVLTIGMSVDANVLIFERIREEMRFGKGLKVAIQEGFQKAMAAILDANITTLLTAIVLAVFGSGPIRGFATTLIMGIFTSFFAAVVISRLLFIYAMSKNMDFKFTTSFTKNWFQNTNFQFVKNRKKFYIISGIVILIGLGSLFTKGLDLGVDFTGGRTYKVEFHDQVANNKLIKENLEKAFGSVPTVKAVDDDYTVSITTKYLITDASQEASDKVETKLNEGLASLGAYDIPESKMIAPTISSDLRSSSFYAILFSLIIIFLYIVFRFRKWQYGLGALVAMAHDVLVVLGLFSIFWGVFGFSMEIDQAFIAAILTVVGYSINDTVVVFDRIREFLATSRKKDNKEIINNALNSTMSRTINTSVSTFIVLLIIFLFGGESIKGFTFALMIGVVVGTYSSLFIATPAVIDLEKEKEEKI
ncbi:protein translocase subunit SecDF [Putridiphycobacter roseus]|uniref:Multifunctional fusion protein n=1 Tax=Putridiphycobacter roseus TaxID=2219161 RepID=A0A2W1NN99_9FLAO|nr:protein translocase subunit SecDF [Putridiphycobacter roseus]PZE16058.1 protein translocase subunit SecDF [Putridiphycobacter roseus]